MSFVYKYRRFIKWKNVPLSMFRVGVVLNRIFLKRTLFLYFFLKIITLKYNNNKILINYHKAN